MSPLTRGEVTAAITRLSGERDRSFQERTRIVQAGLEECSIQQILEHLDFAGVIPEIFDHDSTEEKLCAKYHDLLLTRALRELGLDAKTIEERADAADVSAKGDGYSIVGDAKAFRLSRTAKNQKDFKVEALDKWRKGADYACLVCPLYQYPRENSQIYLQAVRYRVTLCSYTHLAFLLRQQRRGNLKRLWETTRGLAESKSAEQYWGRADGLVVEISGASREEWQRERRASLERLPAQAQEQIRYLEEEKKRIAGMRHDALIRSLIKAMKIDAKIGVIRRTAGL